jgi:hypothetical protein
VAPEQAEVAARAARAQADQVARREQLRQVRAARRVLALPIDSEPVSALVMRFRAMPRGLIEQARVEAVRALAERRLPLCQVA